MSAAHDSIATSTSSAGSRSASRLAYRDYNVLRWFIAYAMSTTGDSGYFLALGWATSKVASPSGVGMVLATAAVPRALLMLSGGVITDRIGPRRIVLGGDAARSIIIVLVAVYLFLTSPVLWLLVTIAVIFGVFDAFFLPAVGSLPPLIADRNQVTQIQGMRAFAIRVGNTAGPLMAGLMMALYGPAAAFAIAGGLYASSFILLLSVRMKPPSRASGVVASHAHGGWSDLVAGLRYSHSDTLIFSLMLSTALIELGTTAPLVIGILLLARGAGWGASGAGLVLAAFGIGSGLSALLVSVARTVPRAGAVYACTSVAGAMAFGLVMIAPNVTIAFALCAFAGLAFGLNGALAFVFVQAAAQPPFLGRVMSLLSLISFGIAPLSLPLYGVGVTEWGARPMFAACAVISLLGSAIAFGSRPIRKLRLLQAGVER